MSQVDQTSLSKTISYALRHAPHEFGLELDEQWWTSIEQLIEALSMKSLEYTEVDQALIEEILQNMEKKRWEIKGERIRAMYGHSVPEKIKYTPTIPPLHLYHGTSEESYELIKQGGLKSMSRQYVHLTTDPDLAIIVARRHTKNPVLLTIKAQDANLGGIEFYSPSEGIWLAEAVPAEFINC